MRTTCHLIRIFPKFTQSDESSDDANFTISTEWISFVQETKFITRIRQNHTKIDSKRKKIRLEFFETHDAQILIHNSVPLYKYTNVAGYKHFTRLTRKRGRNFSYMWSCTIQCSHRRRRLGRRWRRCCRRRRYHYYRCCCCCCGCCRWSSLSLPIPYIVRCEWVQVCTRLSEWGTIAIEKRLIVWCDVIVDYTNTQLLSHTKAELVGVVEYTAVHAARCLCLCLRVLAEWANL